MEDETDKEDEIETFELELSASEMYSLNMILHHNVINMDNAGFSHTAEVISREVSDVMNSENFTEAMNDEVEVFKEQHDMSQFQNQGNVDIPGMEGGVQ